LSKSESSHIILVSLIIVYRKRKCSISSFLNNLKIPKLFSYFYQGFLNFRTVWFDSLASMVMKICTGHWAKKILSKDHYCAKLKLYWK